MVPTGKHHYRFATTTDVAATPPFYIDTIQCRSTPIVANTSGQFNFDEGFIAPEFGGEFRIDNSVVQNTTYSARPWALAAGQTASITFSCGCKSHSEISFNYTGVNPTAGQQLKFYIDGVLQHTFGNTYNAGYVWGNFDFVSPTTGAHDYEWRFSTNVAAQPPYWIDTVKCL